MMNLAHIKVLQLMSKCALCVSLKCSYTFAFKVLWNYFMLNNCSSRIQRENKSGIFLGYYLEFMQYSADSILYCNRNTSMNFSNAYHKIKVAQ